MSAVLECFSSGVPFHPCLAGFRGCFAPPYRWSAPKRPRIHRAPPPLDHTGTWASIQRAAADRDPHGGISLGIEIVIEQHRVARRSRERSAESRAAGLSQSQAERGGGRSRRQPSRRIAGGGSAGGGGGGGPAAPPPPPPPPGRAPHAFAEASVCSSHWSLITGRSSPAAHHRSLGTLFTGRSSHLLERSSVAGDRSGGAPTAGCVHSVDRHSAIIL